MPPQEEKEKQPAPPMSSYSDDMASFYAAWAEREEELAAALTAALPSRHVDALVGAALDHVAAYYEHKSRLAERDVVAALDPRWLNPLERAFLWAWGWKPALAFRFLTTTSAELDALRAATSAAERDVERDLAAAQESLAGPRVLAALRRQAPAARNGEVAHDEAVDAVGRALRVLLASADALRERTLRAVVAALPPDQAATFVAALLTFHVSVRRAGRDWNSSAARRRADV